MPVSIRNLSIFYKSANLFFKETEDLRNAAFHCDFFNILKIIPNARRGAAYYQMRSAVFIKQIVSWS